MADSSVNSVPKKGNPPRYTAEQVSAALHKSRGMVSHAARALGCDPDTVRNYAKRHPTVAAALHEEREQTTDIAELALYRAIEAGEAWAVCFYLKTQGKERGYVERHEYTGKNGDPLAVKVYEGVDPDGV
jgi:hypothetical protein